MLSLIEITESNKKKLINELKDRMQEVDNKVVKSVEEILGNVKENGDKALFEYTKNFDKVELDNLVVSSEEIDECYKKVEDEFTDILKESKDVNEDAFTLYHKNLFWIMPEKSVDFWIKNIPSVWGIKVNDF